jgi:hypothetical protein
MVSVSSCYDLLFVLFGGNNDPHYEYIYYNLALGFQDASGNDLVKGIEQAEWSSNTSYVFDILTSDVYESWDYDPYYAPTRPGVRHSKLSISLRDDGRYYLENTLSTDEESKIIYMLQCPSIFGDGEAHEIVTYWDIPQGESDRKYAKCNRIVFDGNETAIQTSNSSYYTAIITLSD